MSWHFTLFIGPYAEWRRRLGKVPVRNAWEEPWFEPLIEGGSLTLGMKDELPEIKVGRVRYAQYRFMPAQWRPNCPPRQMAFHDGMADRGNEDWSWINPRAEIDWFLEAFSAELNNLTAHFGAGPTVGWGVIMNY